MIGYSVSGPVCFEFANHTINIYRMQKNPNPQGKGMVPVLESLARVRPCIRVPPKHLDQISNELFTSLFVLHSHFQFRPVVGRTYWLYRQRDSFKLSMVAPEEWQGTSFGKFIGECRLHEDITWTLVLDPYAAEDENLQSMIASRRQEFEVALQKASTVDDLLPVYVSSLPFYQRVFAAGLAGSLKQSMLLSGIQGLSYREASKLLPQG